MDDLTALLVLAALFSGVLVAAGSLPVRLLDWIDRHVLGGGVTHFPCPSCGGLTYGTTVGLCWPCEEIRP